MKKRTPTKPRRRPGAKAKTRPRGERHVSPKRTIEDTPLTIAKRYKLPTAIVEQIKAVAPIYGSQGRALQLATELLTRLSRPLKVEMPTGAGAAVVGMTYKLTPRTIELIDTLVEQYGIRGAVLAACVEILDTRLKIIVQDIERRSS